MPNDTDINEYVPAGITPPTPPPIGNTTAEFKQPELPTSPAPSPASYVAPAKFTPETVAGKMEGLLANGSPYVERAKSQATMDSQKRGLLNSSMAATAGEKAAIESALPIAQQDAQASLTAGMAGYQGKLDAAKSRQAYEQDTAMVGTQAAASSAIQRQAAEETSALDIAKAALSSGLSYQEASQKAAQSVYDAAVASGASKQEADQKAAAAVKEVESKIGLISAQTKADVTLENMKQAGAMARQTASDAIDLAKVSDAKKQDALLRFAQFHEQYTASIENVQRDPNVPTASKTAVINQLWAEYQNNIKMVADLTGYTVNWS